MTYIAFLLAGLFVGVCVGYWYAWRKKPPFEIKITTERKTVENKVFVDFAIIEAVLKHHGMIAIRKEMLSSLQPTRH